MPSSPNYKRNLAQEKKTAKARGDDVKNKNRKQAKRTFEKTHGVCNGDVDHRNRNTGNNSQSNLRCIPSSTNRSISRKSTAAKYDTSKKRKS